MPLTGMCRSRASLLHQSGQRPMPVREKAPGLVGYRLLIAGDTATAANWTHNGLRGKCLAAAHISARNLNRQLVASCVAV